MLVKWSDDIPTAAVPQTSQIPHKISWDYQPVVHHINIRSFQYAEKRNLKNMAVSQNYNLAISGANSSL